MSTPTPKPSAPVPPRHPLPWHQRDWVHLDPHLDPPTEPVDRPYALRIGHHDSTTATLTRAGLIELRAAIDAALAAPYLVLICGGDGFSGEDARTLVEQRLDTLHRRHPTDLLVAHAGRPDGPDSYTHAWCARHGVAERIGVLDPSTGGNVALVFPGADARDQAATAAYEGIPLWLPIEVSHG